MRFTKLVDFKKTLSLFFIVAFLFSLSWPLTAVKADDVPMGTAAATADIAVTALQASPLPAATNAAKAQKEVLELTYSQMIGPMIKAALVSMIVNVAQFALDTMAYQSAVWVASGGEGQSSLFNGQPADEAWKNFGNDILGEMVGSLNEGLEDYLDVNLNLCGPGDPALRLGLQLGLTSFYQPPKPECNWQEISDNWAGFAQTIQETSDNPTESMLNALAEGLRPGQNTLSYFVETNMKIHGQVLEAKGSLFSKWLSSDGFSGVKNIITGYEETPADLVKTQLTSDLDRAKHQKQEFSFMAAMTNSDLLVSIGTHTASVFLNTLLSQLVQNVYKGLFESVETDVDIFSEQSADTSGRERAEDKYAGMVSTTPMRLEDYNVLTEFVSCPGSSVTRQINNCVTDATLMQAISRSLSDNPMTVAEAIEQGYLHGEWALYPSSDLSHNQDIYCYTYGYCYGNLVKLRKARVISIGWEMAANSENNSDSAPVTLQEAVDGFDDCNSDNKIDAEHPWCHLIDPNWILKYPTQRCDASMIGELTFSSASSASRSGACVDAPSCVAEGADGSCEGYGYCVREKNTWSFSGDECPEEYASCMSFTNSDTSETSSWLFNTLDQSVCNAENAGCAWYRANKYLDQQNTADDDTDDAYEWLPGDEIYVSADRADDTMTFTTDGVVSSRASYAYNSDGSATDDGVYDLYAFEDRIYFNSEVETCSEESVGCSEVYPIDEDTVLNVLRNPSFEDDDDSDGAADFWTVTGSTFDYDEEGSNSEDGSASYLLNSGDSLSQTNIPLQQGTFYTVSLYTKGGEAELTLDFYASDNSAVDLTGYSTDCAADDLDTLSKTLTASDDFTSFDCTFTTPILDESRLYLVADLTIASAAAAYVDAVQLEANATPSDFRDGYGGSTMTTDYLQIPPAWLGCEGEASDPADCDDYSTVCAATEAGCSLYTPTDSDPSVPAVISDEDQCPSECAGYATYRQEDTAYDSGEFPLYFIADTAEACGSSYVGCDEFTNLETEGVETFSYLRACVTPEMDAGSVYFTWEGSDMAGYQLVSYQLLESDLSDSDSLTFDESGEDESNIGDAPCTNWSVISANTLECDDSQTAIEAQSDCDEHADILTEPDCREFYDSEGYIHYRLYSETVSVSDDCTAYRISEVDTTDDDGNGIADDCEYSGGFQTEAGECRYFIEPNESTDCPATAAGCREYTGGSSRNSSVIFSEYFEEGSYDNWETSAGSPTLSISNESVAVDGHSLRVLTTSENDAFRVQHDYTSGGAACADEDGCLSVDEECTVEYGEVSCGVLVDQVTAGKTFVVRFWAKGTGELEAAMVDSGGTADAHYFGDSVELTSGWQLYELGPLDTSISEFADFDENAVLAFFGSAFGQIFYLDNIQLEQTEEDLTLIKDSWVTPSTCDETADGASSDQYYLGCDEYTDQNDVTFYIYQFSHLCSEAAVGCSAFYASQESESPYSEVYNLTCSADAAVTVATACSMSGEEVCTILIGSDSCQFDYEGNLPTPLPNNISLGPEAVYVQADEVRYLIDDGEHSCTEENMGCVEVGQPTFTQDHTAVESFESVYLLNQPDEYDDTLCSDNELFCAEWASTEDGNFYFKNPEDQNCEYKTSVSINGTSYSGWFREDTTEFCYGSGYCSGNTSTACDNDANCLLAGVGECVINSGSYIVNGNYSGLWRNGDTDYDNWAGTCGDQYDLCSEFTDPLDTREGEDLDGASYYYIDNEKIGDEGTISANRCNGQVSLEGGCILFNDATDTSSDYAASSSYLASEHADVFFGDSPRSLQDPVSCDNAEDGEFTLTDNTVFNVCVNRCAYEVADDNEITNLAVAEGPTDATASTTTFYGAACYTADDCQLGADIYGIEVEATCDDLEDDSAVDLSDYYSTNDSNRVVKVYRDRVCAEWLACSSSNAAWEERTNTWTDVCESVGLCDEYDTSSSEGGECSGVISEDPIVLDSDKYSARDVSWYGLEYSGYAIPDQLPVEFYTQVDIAAAGYCTNSDGEIVVYEDGPIIVSCTSRSNCSVLAPTCTPTEDLSRSDRSTYDISDTGYYLVYVAASCDEANSEACTAGYCTDSGLSCSEDSQCATGECIVGYCELASTTICVEDTDCTDTDSDYPDCQSGVCTDTTTSATGTQETCMDDDDCTSGSCVPGALAKTGSCYNSACLVGIDGQPFDPDYSEDKSCRGYPEANSPFPNSVVAHWIDPDGLYDGFDSDDLFDATDIDSAAEADALPYDYVSGFNDANTCSPVPDEYQRCAESGEVCESDDDCSGAATDTCQTAYSISDDCLCSYDKIEYGDSAAVRYYPERTSEDDLLDGVCVGGVTLGASCTDDQDCNPNDTDDDDTVEGGGVCQMLSHRESMYGWDGYCIERDSSIQIFGSPEETGRACLTWLPVDHLLGSRDAYANDTEAGYPLTDTYYCGELDYYKDVRISNWRFLNQAIEDGSLYEAHIACAEHSGSCSGDEDYDCVADVYCPDGYFAAMGACAGSSASDDKKAEAFAFSCSDPSMWFDNDCPYVCVPENSIHDTGDDAGSSCVEEDHDYTSINNGTTVYIFDGAYGNDFDDAVGSLVDCVVPGLLANDTTYSDDASNSNFDYRGLTLPVDYYVGCRDIIQASSEVDGNKAWTNRLWQDGGYSIDSDNYSVIFDYVYSTIPLEFGAAFSPESVQEVFGISDSSGTVVKERPLPIFQCYVAIEDAGGLLSIEGLSIDPAECNDDIFIGPYDSRINLSEGSENIPRSYQYVSGSVTTSNEDDKCTTDGDCQDFDCNDDGHCDGGPYNGAECTSDSNCGMSSATCDNEPVESCSTCTSYLCNWQTSGGEFVEEIDVGDDIIPADIIDRLSQLFTNSYGDLAVTFNDDAYETTSNPETYDWDISDEGDDYGTGHNADRDPAGPTIASLGLCYGSQCMEGDEGNFTINGYDSTSLEGSGGSYHASVKFYAWADSNQMPIRDVTVDWGDGRKEGTYQNYAWPLNSQSGTQGDEQSYYKNRRGLINQNTEECGSDSEDFGLSSEACMSAYFNFEKDYYCSRGMAGDGGEYISTLEACEYADEETGRLLNSPCTGGTFDGIDATNKCVFQPRVHVKDNWGWCTGECDYNYEDESSGCYGEGINGECRSSYCPGGTDGVLCPDLSSTINPWINYDGVIVLDWQEL